MNNKQILTFTKYPYNGPSSRYRYYNYSDCFNKKAVFLHFKPFFSKAYLSTQNKSYKVILSLIAYLKRFFILVKLFIYPRFYQTVIIEYELFPYFPSFFEYVLKKRKIAYIVDYDDAIFHRYDQNKNGLVRFLLKNKIAKVMQYASAVIVGNEYIQTYAQKYNSNTLLLPTVVLLEQYKKAMLEHPYKAADSPFVIGWIGSKSTSAYVLDILPAIEKFVNLYKAECHFIGFDERLLTPEMLKKCRISVIPWSENTEIQEMLDFDIGVMPLTDDAWSKGKCGFKLIQYMSCKKPVVASPVGVNTSIVEEGVNGFLASTNEQWFTALEKLYQDINLRKSMSENNWNKINEQYNHNNNCKLYVDLINDVVNNE